MTGDPDDAGRSTAAPAPARTRRRFVPASARDDAVAGVVLGVESVPDGLASGLLAGVNPVFGLYGYLFGTVGGALFTSTALMAVQATGAMSIIVADVDLGAGDDPARTLFTLSVLTGAVMIVAGLLRAGALLRFVSTAVMTGFITAVGANIVLGQLEDFTGYDAAGSGRIARAADVVLHPGRIDVATLVVGATTVVAIVVLQRTRLGALGLVVAVAGGSGLAGLFDALGRQVTLVGDVVEVPNSLPLPRAPRPSEVFGLLVPAASLAFVGLVQGAGVSAGVPNPDGRPADVSRDFVGQGAGNVVAGIFQGMPVGGSMSASSLVSNAGARSRGALFVAGATMAAVVLALAEVVELVAMPSLAGLLMVVGVTTIKPARVASIVRTGTIPATVMTITLVLTMIVPLQYSVLVGVGLSVLLFVVGQSSRLVTRRLRFHPDGRVELVDPPEQLDARQVVVLQPYGSLFFATAPRLREQLPRVTPSSERCVVVLRIRDVDDAGATVMEVLRAYAADLRDAGGRLEIVTNSHRFVRQLRSSGVAAVVGADRIHLGSAFLGETTRRVHDEAVRWAADEAEVDPDR